VTPFAGTTRDYLKERVLIGDSAINLIDMAGWRASAHLADKEGLVKSRKMAESADGLLVVLDGSRMLGRDDERLILRYSGKRMIVVVNKSDLLRRIDGDQVRSLAGEAPVAEVSALKRTGLEALKRRIGKLCEFPRDLTGDIIVNARQRDILRDIHVVLGKALALLDEQYPEEIAAEEIRAAIPLIGRLTGEIRTEDVMKDVFSRFCVGK
jgi:tRNA modification GTPase